MVDLPSFILGGLEINLIQGGMGVGVSGRNLASAVANCGGAGTIASVELGSLKGYYGDEIICDPQAVREIIRTTRRSNTLDEAYEKIRAGIIAGNQHALRDEIRAARELSEGVIGVNIMHAAEDFRGLVTASVEEEVNFIISGAGIPKDLPRFVGNRPIALIPIVSSLRVAKLITKAWSKFGKIPDAFIVEGPEAGGHLGFSHDDLVAGTAPTLEDIAVDVITFAQDTFDSPVPVVVAGGVYTGADIARYIGLGAAGVQMATRFVTTAECDAANGFKRAYLEARQEDLEIIKSPVGMPGRAIRNGFLDRAGVRESKGGAIDFDCATKCLRTCKQEESRYCIASALIEAQRGNLGKGFAFAGSNAYRATPETCLDQDGNFITVRTLMDRLSSEYSSAVQN